MSLLQAVTKLSAGISKGTSLEDCDKLRHMFLGRIGSSTPFWVWILFDVVGQLANYTRLL